MNGGREGGREGDRQTDRFGKFNGNDFLEIPYSSNLSFPGEFPQVKSEHVDDGKDEGETEQVCEDVQSKDETASCKENKMRVLAFDDTVRTRLLKDGEEQQVC